MDPAVTGLPAQLAREPGPQAGLTAVHKRAAGEVHAIQQPGSAALVAALARMGVEGAEALSGLETVEDGDDRLVGFARKLSRQP